MGAEYGDLSRRDALGILSATAAAGLGVGALSSWNKARIIEAYRILYQETAILKHTLRKTTEETNLTLLHTMHS